MRAAALILSLLWPLTGAAGENAEPKRLAVVVALDRPSEAVESVPGTHEHAAALVDALKSGAGYTDVRALIGPVASDTTVMQTVRSAMQDVGPSGFLLFVYSGHGAGGDFGEPALLTHGASVADPLQTGVDVSALSALLQPQGPDQQILIVIDAAHLGSVDGVALLGPTAPQWPQMPATGVSVITVNVSAVGTPGLEVLPSLTAAVAGNADMDANGEISLAEVIRFVSSGLRDDGGPWVDVAGNADLDRMVGRVQVSEIETTSGRNVRALPTALVVSGGVAGAASLVLYALKRSQCVGDSGDLRCGDGAAYRRYQMSQHALGIAGGGLVLAGLGIRLMPSAQSVRLELGGSF